MSHNSFIRHIDVLSSLAVHPFRVLFLKFLIMDVSHSYAYVLPRRRILSQGSVKEDMIYLASAVVFGAPECDLNLVILIQGELRPLISDSTPHNISNFKLALSTQGSVRSKLRTLLKQLNASNGPSSQPSVPFVVVYASLLRNLRSNTMHNSPCLIYCVRGSVYPHAVTYLMLQLCCVREVQDPTNLLVDHSVNLQLPLSNSGEPQNLRHIDNPLQC